MRKNPNTSDSPKNSIKDEIEISSIADFVTAASHDLKNPLASIKAYAQIAKKRLQDSGDDKTAHYMDKIEEQTDRAAQLITEILDTGRISRGKLAVYKRPFRLDKLVSETVEDLQITIHTHKIIEESRIKVKIEADKERIRRVLFNLGSIVNKVRKPSSYGIVTML